MSPREDRLERLLHRLEAAWGELEAAYAGLPEARLLEPGVVGDWSVKDILAHVAAWEQEALRHLPTIAAGGRPPRYAASGGIDAFNARAAERGRALSLARVRAELDETHGQLVAFLRSVPAEQLAPEARFRRRLRLDTFGHYPEHAAQIRAWREQRPAGGDE